MGRVARARVHRAELPHAEPAAAVADALLAEEHGPGGRQPHRQHTASSTGLSSRMAASAPATSITRFQNGYAARHGGTATAAAASARRLRRGRGGGLAGGHPVAGVGKDGVGQRRRAVALQPRQHFAGDPLRALAAGVGEQGAHGAALHPADLVRLAQAAAQQVEERGGAGGGGRQHHQRELAAGAVRADALAAQVAAEAGDRVHAGRRRPRGARGQGGRKGGSA